MKNIRTRGTARNSSKSGSQSPPLPFSGGEGSGTASTRVGATLVEVLVSLLITAIGIVGVASVFPVAVLRAVQATRLNKSVLLRLNVEELIDIDPRIVHDPDGDGNFAEHQIPGFRNYVVDPLGHMMIEAKSLNTNLPGSLGGLNRWGLGQILDPVVTKQSPPATFPAPSNPNARLDHLKFKAAEMVTLPDTWITRAEDILTISVANSITFPAGVLADVTFSDTTALSITQMPSRVIVSTPEGLQSVRRIVTGNDGTTLTLDRNLPSHLVGVPMRVIVETKEFRFSTMLTVRKSKGDGTPLPILAMNPSPLFGGLINDPAYSNNGSFQKTTAIGSASVDVVVFHNRRFSKEDEAVYTIHPQKSMGDGDEKGRWYLVNFSAVRPAMKRGGFMLDPVHARWYRIQKIENENNTEAFILLDRRKPTSDLKNITGGIFMKGVIEVYPIGTK